VQRLNNISTPLKCSSILASMSVQAGGLESQTFKHQLRMADQLAITAYIRFT